MALENCFESTLENIKRQEDSKIKIALVGQPGAGKSSLINSLTGEYLAETGRGTDTTREAREYDYNFQKLVDLPGYGTKRFDFSSWSEQFNPGQYDVYLCVFKGKITDSDEELFAELKKFSLERQRDFFLVRTHSDGEDEKSRESIRQDIFSRTQGIFDKIYFVEQGRNRFGIDKLKDGLQKVDFDSLWRKRIIYSFRRARDSYLNSAKSRAEDTVDSYSKAASLNGINPLPGVDVAADIGIYMSMFSDIRAKYDIENDDLTQYAVPIAKKLLELLTKEGVLILLKNFAGKMAVKSVTRYIPFIGQAFAATLGYKMAHMAGEDYNDDCYSFSKDVMDKLIDEKIKTLHNIAH